MVERGGVNPRDLPQLPLQHRSGLRTSAILDSSHRTDRPMFASLCGAPCKQFEMGAVAARLDDLVEFIGFARVLALLRFDNVGICRRPGASVRASLPRTPKKHQFRDLDEHGPGIQDSSTQLATGRT